MYNIILKIYIIFAFIIYLYIFIFKIVASLVSAAFPSIAAQKDYIVIYVELILKYI